jgi:predicted MPP superfamily phosphohydrolase
MVVGRGRRNPPLQQIAYALLDLSLLGGWVARWSYRLGFHGKLSVTKHELQLKRGYQPPRPLVLAFASDLHGGPTTHPDLFAALLDELIAHRPDVLLLGGDYVWSKSEQIEVLANVLSKCDPPLGKFGVLGNHDLWTDDAHIMRALQEAGVEILVNENRHLPAPFDGISICAIDDPWTGTADVAKAFEGARSIRVFLTHSPDGLLLLKGHQFDIALAGHTHGGQVALRDGTQILTAGGPLARSYGRGRFEIAGQGTLIVSRGVGCSNIPVRINSDPELVICTLLPG